MKKFAYLCLFLCLTLPSPSYSTPSVDERLVDYMDVYASCITNVNSTIPLPLCSAIAVKLMENENLTTRDQRLEALSAMEKQKTIDMLLVTTNSPISSQYLPESRASFGGNFGIAFATCMTNIPTGLWGAALLPATCSLKAAHVADLNLSERDTMLCMFFYVFPPWFPPSYEQMVNHCMTLFSPAKSV